MFGTFELYLHNNYYIITWTTLESCIVIQFFLKHVTQFNFQDGHYFSRWLPFILKCLFAISTIIITWTTPASCMVMQFSGCLDNWNKALAVLLWTFSSPDLRYRTSGATAPSRPNATRLLPQLQHLAMASARCRRSLSSPCKYRRQIMRSHVLVLY